MALEFFPEADRSWASMAEMVARDGGGVAVMEAGNCTGDEHAELGRPGPTVNPAGGEVTGGEHDTALADGGTSSAGSAESSGSREHGRKRKEVQSRTVELDGSASDNGEQPNQAASKRRLSALLKWSPLKNRVVWGKLFKISAMNT